MSAKSVTYWYGVCDQCGQEDDDSRPTEEEARAFMEADPIFASGFAELELRPFRVSLLRGRD